MKLIYANILFLCFSIPHLTATDFDFDFALQSQFAKFSENGESAQALSFKNRFISQFNVNQNVSIYAEYDYVFSELKDQYFDGVTDNGKILIIAPNSHRFNQSFISWKQNEFEAQFGRFTYNLNEGTLVSDFSHWPVEQSFDGLKWTTNFSTQSRFSYLYAFQVNRIYGSEAGSQLSIDDMRYNSLNGIRPQRERNKHNIDLHLIDLQYDELDHFKFAGYFLQLNHREINSYSSKTLGGRLVYKIKPQKVTYQFQLETAVQNPSQLGTNQLVYYYDLEASARYQSIEPIINYRVYTAKDNFWFTTPFSYDETYFGPYWLYHGGTKGLRSRNTGLIWRKKGLKASMFYYLFNHDLDNSFIGNQWLVNVAYRPNRVHEFDLKIALFNQKPQYPYSSTDRNKLWFTYSYNM